MKDYPAISRDIQFGLPVYAFDKLDGSNIRAEWTRKHGFNKFGSRKRLLGTDQEFLPEAIRLVKDNFEEQLAKIFVKQRFDRVMCFFEFYGENSFAGVHVKEPHRVVLFDVNPYKKGIMFPREFLSLFGHLDIPRLLHQGNCTHPFVDSVKNNSLEGLTSEGVVCKAPGKGKMSLPIMFKVKTEQWITKLKTYCGDDERLFRELL